MVSLYKSGSPLQPKYIPYKYMDTLGSTPEVYMCQVSAPGEVSPEHAHSGRIRVQLVQSFCLI